MVEHYFRDHVSGGEELFAHTTRDDFWQVLEDWYRKTIADLGAQPWTLGLMRAVWRLPLQLREAGALKTLFDMGQHWMQQMLRRGRELKTMRSDLPESLLLAWITGLDIATDHWMAEHLTDLDPANVDLLSRVGMDLLHRLLDPPRETERDKE